MEPIPSLEWDEFRRDIFRWRQGEHIAAIGPTNSGKTTLLLSLAPLRKYVVFVATKPKDKTVSRLQRQGFHKVERWEKLDPTVYPKRLLWPPIHKLDLVGKQRAAILHAMQEIYTEGHWCVILDELWYIIHQLQLERTVRTYLSQSRSLGISLVVGTQRPAYVPLEIYDQSTHLFFWRDNDERNLKRISGIGWLSARRIVATVSSLPQHQCLYINTRDGTMITTRAPAPTEVANAT